MRNSAHSWAVHRHSAAYCDSREVALCKEIPRVIVAEEEERDALAILRFLPATVGHPFRACDLTSLPATCRFS